MTQSRPSRRADAFRVLIVAALYFILARLGLLLAIPPGVATAVWPPSGLALAALLIWGNTVAPGVWIGSCLANLSITLASPGGPPLSLALCTAMLVGAGALLQALVGARLIRRHVGIDDPLVDPKKIVLFVVLGGPVADVVSATVGVTGFFLAGMVLPGDIPWNWATWWIGDTIGCLLVAPLVLCFAGRPRTIWRRRLWTVALPLGMAFGAVVLSYVTATRLELAALRADFRLNCDNLGAGFEQHLTTYSELLRFVSRFVTCVGDVTRERFIEFIATVPGHYSGVHALSWNVVAAAGESGLLEARGRRENGPGFRLSRYDSTGEQVPVTATAAGVFVLFIDPVRGNEEALGFDVSSDSVRLRTVEQARDTGQMCATERLRLVQEPDSQHGVLLMHPVYKTGRDPGTPQRRRSEILGFATGVFRIGDMVRASIAYPTVQGVTMRLVDADAGPLAALLFESGGGSASQSSFEGFEWRRTYLMGGRRWQLSFEANRDYVAAKQLWTSWSVLASGLLLASLLGGFMLALTGQTERSAQLVTERTAALSASNALLEKEVAVRTRIEEEVRSLNSSLEARVLDRTRELETARQSLQLQLEQQHQLEERMRQSQKLEAVGRLAGGIAHDFNNLLTIIIATAQFVSEDLDEKSQAQRDMTQILRAADRAAILTRQLLAYSRRQVLQPKVFDVNELVREMTAMLSRLIGEHIRIELDLAPGALSVRADPSQIEMALVNLAANSRDAMPSGGLLAIRTRGLASPPDGVSELPAEPCVVLEVSDTGCGMDPRTLDQVFEPFFTTKDVGRGTGLGLSAVYGAITQTGGHISGESVVGVGTTFRIYLARVDADAARPAQQTQPAQPVQTVAGRTILVVEDELELRALACRTLTQAGYTVLEAISAEWALDLFRHHPGPIHLVLTDVVMPSMTGPRLIERMGGGRSEMRVLYMSGYTQEALGAHGLLMHGVEFLEKPFKPMDLLARVQALLLKS
ncbi:MAG: CHASE domain-containing protein [Candidatus Wallbacteria bacterium]|nr:CHASE domain-containing protein [Candidatus Wallbacteria bacterium]